MDDWQLISEYVRTGADGPFRSLVDRHAGLVYSVAMREVREAETAREVSQAVFILLARKARSFRSSVVLSAWLFRTTRFVALRASRSEHRRQRREQEAVRMQTFNEPSEAWPRLAPVVDETLADLSESDRAALLLRFYEDRNLREVGTKLRISEDAAKKRVSRALDKLRSAFARRGFTVPATVVTGLLSGKLAEAAPASLVNAIASSALSANATTMPALVEQVLDAWHWAKVKLGLTCGIALLVALFAIRTVALHDEGNATPTTAGAPTISNPVAAAAVVQPAARVARPFLFKVVDAETGLGIPAAQIHPRYWGERLESKEDLFTDAEGICQIPLPNESLRRFDLGILAPGYVQKFFTWWPDHFGPLPRSYTFKVERGVGIGGFLRDPDGRPVPNASILLKFPGVGESDARERQRERLGFWADLPAATTDAAGRWQCANVPPRYIDFSISVKHPDFPNRAFAVQAHGDSHSEALPINQLYDGTAVLILKPGLSLGGIVVDEQDKPIAGAGVCISRWWADPKKPTAVTGPDGKFTLRNIQSAGLPLTVFADGFAPERTNVDPTNAEDLKIQLKPASLLRVRVVDPAGQPLSRADVAIEQWREHGTVELREPTDENGIFEWRSAPSDAMTVCVLKGGYAASRNNKVRANGQEHVITLKPQFRVMGRVTDADSGQPLATFKAIPGYGPPSGSKWDIGETTYGRDGQYELSFSEERPPYRLRIVADGYEPVESTQMTDEQNPQVCDFELHRTKPAQAIKGVVLSPKGRPMPHVDVALCTIEIGVHIARGRVARNSYSKPIKTDEAGKFEFPANSEVHTIVAVAPEGVARLLWKADGKPIEIVLQPWGRIEGVVRLASGSAGKEILLFDHSRDRYSGGTSLDFDFSATTDAQGRFVIEQAPPGEFSLFINPKGGTPYSYETPVTVKAGETTRAQIGGDGLKIHGRFEMAGDYEVTNWSNQIGLLYFHTNVGDPEPPPDIVRSDRIALERWKRAFWNSDQGRILAAKRKSILLEVTSDGSFTAESVQPGAYELSIHLYDGPVDRTRSEALDYTKQLGCLGRKKIVIPETSPPDQSVDLGTITLLPTRRQAKH
jgi:RNA polymerase sigma factor (sigma-70 family)